MRVGGGLFKSPLRHHCFPRSETWGFAFLCRSWVSDRTISGDCWGNSRGGLKSTRIGTGPIPFGLPRWDT